MASLGTSSSWETRPRRTASDGVAITFTPRPWINDLATISSTNFAHPIT